MARGGFFETAIRILVRESIKNIKASGQTRGPAQNATKKQFKTKYRNPEHVVHLASQGMHSYPVSGESFYAGNFEKLFALFSGREEVLTRAFLIPEPRNPWDKNAIAVVIAEYVVGHIPRHTAAHFADFLAGRAGECGARFYFNQFSGFHSIELDCDFPPRLATDPANEYREILGTDKDADYSMGQITTRGTFINLNSWGSGSITLSKEKPHFGVARLTAGFRDSPEVIDEATLQVIGYPYETISYDFNLFARSFGGEVRVRYKMEMKENGKPKIWLDSNALPKFKTKKY